MQNLFNSLFVERSAIQLFRFSSDGNGNLPDENTCLVGISTDGEQLEEYDFSAETVTNFLGLFSRAPSKAVETFVGRLGLQDEDTVRTKVEGFIRIPSSRQDPQYTYVRKSSIQKAVKQPVDANHNEPGRLIIDIGLDTDIVQEYDDVQNSYLSLVRDLS